MIIINMLEEYNVTSSSKWITRIHHNDLTMPGVTKYEQEYLFELHKTRSSLILRSEKSDLVATITY